MLTKKQKQLFDFLNEYIGSRGISPSFEEMKKALSLKSKSGIHRLITSLEQRGFIKRLKHKARAMQVVKNPEEMVINNNTKTNTISIPLVGTIAAGAPIEAINLENERIQVPINMISTQHQYFGLYVKGESMIEEGIMNGDIALIEHSKTVQNGKIAAVLIKGEEVTLKKIKIELSSIKLIPANPLFREKIYPISDIEIQGKLKGIIRKYH